MTIFFIIVIKLKLIFIWKYSDEDIKAILTAAIIPSYFLVFYFSDCNV